MPGAGAVRVPGAGAGCGAGCEVRGAKCGVRSAARRGAAPAVKAREEAGGQRAAPGTRHAALRAARCTQHPAHCTRRRATTRRPSAASWTSWKRRGLDGWPSSWRWRRLAPSCRRGAAWPPPAADRRRSSATCRLRLPASSAAFFSASAFFGSNSLPMSSICAISAASPRRWPSLQDAGVAARPIANRGARLSNSLVTTSSLSTSRMTSRRAESVLPFGSAAFTPRLAIVIIRSTNGRSSFAFGTVVSMRSWQQQRRRPGCAAARFGAR